MGNLKTFTEFINESYNTDSINEAKRLTELTWYKTLLNPKDIKELSGEVNNTSLKSLKSFSYKGKEKISVTLLKYPQANTLLDLENKITGDFSSSEVIYLQLDTESGISLKAELVLGGKDKGVTSQISQNGDPTFYIGKETIKALYYTNGSDIFKTIEKALDESFAKFGTAIHDKIEMEKKRLGAYSLSIGVINIPTGKTMYDWSIYDSPNSYVFLFGDRLLYAAKDTFEIGDEVKLFDNDSQKAAKWGEDKIIDMAPCNPDAVIEMLYKNGYDYKPKRAFQKSAFKHKLRSSYSIKGTFYLFEKK